MSPLPSPVRGSLIPKEIRGEPPKKICLHTRSAGGRALAAEVDPTTGLVETPQGRAVERRYALQEAARRLLPKFSVARCGTALIPARTGVEVRIHKSSGHASYSGLRMCSSVWVCAVCAAKISERRARELEDAIACWLQQGHFIYFVTYTVPHQRTDALKDLLTVFHQSTSYLKDSHRYKKHRKETGIIGEVFAFEVTYGQNGWHPHGHQLLFASRFTDPLEIEQQLYPIWEKGVARNGLGQTSPDAFKVQVVSPGDEVGEIARYISKGTEGKRWGPAQEMAKAPVKLARRGGASPFELLRIYRFADGEAATAIGLASSDQAGILFTEYALATRGKRALRWSPGLRDHLQLGQEQTDEQLAEQAGEETELLGVIASDDWGNVVRAGWQGGLLEVARFEGWPGVQNILKYLRTSRQNN